MFEFYQLRYFLAVVETGSFTKAAERSFVTQPTLSAGIQKLEASLGVRLFHRSNRRVFLTEAGTRFVERAKAILHQCSLAETELNDVEAPTILRVGMLMTIPMALLGRFLGNFRRSMPRLIIELFEGSVQEITNRLDSGALDIAFTLLRGQSADDSRFAPQSLYTEGYVLALAEGHPLSSKTIVEGGELANEPTIVRTRCEILAETSRYFTDRNVRPRIIYRTAQDERALAVVAAGLGFTTMPESYGWPGIVKRKLAGYDDERTVALLRSPLDMLPEKVGLLGSFAAAAATHLWRPESLF
jgi:DNA-binding transcriptional LysR family regulator